MSLRSRVRDPHRTFFKIEKRKYGCVYWTACHTVMDMRTCAAQVMVDFLMRRGFVSPDEDGYLELLAELRNAECR